MQLYANGFADMIFQFMKLDDVYATFSKRVILDKFSFGVKEIAANFFRYVARDVNKFSAQHMVEDIIGEGIDPMLEDIISKLYLLW